MRNCTCPCSTRGATRGVLLWSKVWRLPGWVRDPDRQEARTPPAGDEKPAADAKERGFRVRGPEPRGTPYPVVRQGSPMIQPGLQGNRLRGCTLWWPLGSAVLAILLQWNNSPNSASMSAHESCAARSPKSPRRAPDRCPHFADCLPHGLGRAPATPSWFEGRDLEGDEDPERDSLAGTRSRAEVPAFFHATIRRKLRAYLHLFF